MNRQDIYGAVWKEPLTMVAERLSVSASALRKACHDADIPVPPRGHWVKASIGRAPDPKPLRGRKDELFVFRKRESAGGRGDCPIERAQMVALGIVDSTSNPPLHALAGARSLNEDLELASQEWVRQQPLLAFLACVEEALDKLPQAQAAAPLSALRSARAALTGSDPIQAALATLTAIRA